MNRKAFTVVEILVVTIIIMIMAGFLLVGVHAARRSGERARMASDLHTISVALDAYKADFGDYPRLQLSERIGGPWNLGNSTMRSGGELLCWALVGPYDATATADFINGVAFPIPTPPGFVHTVIPGDGANGPGFRINATGRGQVYASYLNVERFKIARQPGYERFLAILDSHNMPILYFPMTPAPPDEGHRVQIGGLWYPTSVSQWDPTQPITDVRRRSTYDFLDNEVAFWRGNDVSSVTPLARMQVMLGDRNCNGVIDPNETPPPTLPYLLWSAGQDGLYGPTNPGSPSDVNNCDDVTNLKN